MLLDIYAYEQNLGLVQLLTINSLEKIGLKAAEQKEDDTIDIISNVTQNIGIASVNQNKDRVIKTTILALKK